MPPIALTSLRTIILICLGFTIFTLESNHGSNTDDRIATSIITGFTGAGSNQYNCGVGAYSLALLVGGFGGDIRQRGLAMQAIVSKAIAVSMLAVQLRGYARDIAALQAYFLKLEDVRAFY